MMIFECLAIIAIVIAMCFIFLRAKKREYAFGMLPLAILPIMQLLTKPAIALITGFTSVKPITISVCMVFIALIAESILIGLVSSMLKTKKQKTTFLLMCGGFSLVLAMIFILNSMKVFVVATAFIVM